MLKALQLTFLPVNGSFGLLVLRLWFGLSLLLLHGWPKAANFSSMAANFGDPLGIGPKATLILAIVSEVGCAALVVIGLFSRLAALIIVIQLGVAFFLVHRGMLSGPQSGELALLFVGAALVLVISGPGRFSADAALGSRSS